MSESTVHTDIVEGMPMADYVEWIRHLRAGDHALIVQRDPTPGRSFIRPVTIQCTTDDSVVVDGEAFSIGGGDVAMQLKQRVFDEVESLAPLSVDLRAVCP